MVAQPRARELWNLLLQKRTGVQVMLRLAAFSINLPHRDAIVGSWNHTPGGTKFVEEKKFDFVARLSTKVAQPSLIFDSVEGRASEREKNKKKKKKTDFEGRKFSIQAQIRNLYSKFGKICKEKKESEREGQIQKGRKSAREEDRAIKCAVHAK